MSHSVVRFPCSQIPVQRLYEYLPSREGCQLGPETVSGFLHLYWPSADASSTTPRSIKIVIRCHVAALAKTLAGQCALPRDGCHGRCLLRRTYGS